MDEAAIEDDNDKEDDEPLQFNDHSKVVVAALAPVETHMSKFKTHITTTLRY